MISSKSRSVSGRLEKISVRFDLPGKVSFVKEVPEVQLTSFLPCLALMMCSLVDGEDSITIML